MNTAIASQPRKPSKRSKRARPRYTKAEREIWRARMRDHWRELVDRERARG